MYFFSVFGLIVSIRCTSDDAPRVAIVNTWSTVTPCNMHLRELGEHVRRGILEAGGTPVDFNTIVVTDGIAMGTGAAWIYSTIALLFPGVFPSAKFTDVYYDVTVVVTGLVVLGMALEVKARGRSSEAIRKLIDDLYRLGGGALEQAIVDALDAVGVSATRNVRQSSAEEDLRISHGEGTIVVSVTASKTDGKRVFAIADSRLYALDAAGGAPKLVGSSVWSLAMPAARAATRSGSSASDAFSESHPSAMRAPRRYSANAWRPAP